MKNKQKAYTYEEAKEIYNRINQWIANVDNKISICIAFVTLIIGLVSFRPIYLTTVNINIHTLTLMDTIKIILISTTYLSSIYSLIILLLAIKGKIEINKFDNNKLEKESIHFFGTISKMTYSEFVDRSKNITEDKLINDINSQIYINSIICEYKFRMYNKAVYSIFVLLIVIFICKIFGLI